MSKQHKMMKKFNKILHKQEFWFTVIVYPVAACIYLYAKNSIENSPFNVDTVYWYTELSFVILALLTLYAGWELIDKKLFFKKQGDKLKIKQGQRDWKP